jgi:hypothetical protein
MNSFPYLWKRSLKLESSSLINTGSNNATIKASIAPNIGDIKNSHSM